MPDYALVPFRPRFIFILQSGLENFSLVLMPENKIFAAKCDKIFEKIARQGRQKGWQPFDRQPVRVICWAVAAVSAP